MKFLSDFWESRALPVFIVAVGAILRAGHFGSSFCIDDYLALRDSTYSLPVSQERFRPLFFSLLHYWRGLGPAPETEWWLQLFPFLCAILTLIAMWFVAKRFGGRTAAVGLTLLLATAPLHIDITAEVRIYAMLSLLGLLQILCYLKIRESGKPWLLVLNSLIGAAAMYTQPMYSLYLAGLFLLSLLDRHQISFWKYVASLAGTALLYLPNLYFIFQYSEYVQADPTKFTTHPASAFFKLIALYSTGYNFFRVHDLGLGAKFGLREALDNWPLVLLALVTFGGIAVGAFRQLRRPEERLARRMILTQLIVPFVLAYLGVLVFHRNLTHAQFHIAALPFVLLVFYKGFQGLADRKFLHSAAIGLYALIVGIAIVHYYFEPQHYGRRVNWFPAAQFIRDHVGSDQPLMILDTPYAVNSSYPYLVYYAGSTFASWLPVQSPRDTLKLPEYTDYLRQRAAPYDTVYYLWEPMAKDILDPHNFVIRGMREFAIEEHREIYGPRLEIYRWILRE